MKKTYKLSIILILIIALTLLSSCNVDSNFGLFQMAGESPKKASYNLYKIIGKADKNYIVTSDKGVFIFTPDKNSETLNENKKTLLNGTIASSSVLFATFNSGEMSVVYYDEDNSKYYRVTDSSNKSEEYTDFDGGKYKLVNSFYSIKDDKVAITFENGYYYYGSIDELRSENIKKAANDNDLSYISNGAFYDGENYIYTSDNTSGKKVEKKVYGYLGGENYVYSDGSISNIEGNIETPTQSLTTIYTDNTTSYIIVNGSTDLYIVNDGKVTQKTCQGLENLTVIGIISASESAVDVITSSGGTKNLNLINATIDEFN